MSKGPRGASKMPEVTRRALDAPAEDHSLPETQNSTPRPRVQGISFKTREVGVVTLPMLAVGN